VRQVCSEVAFLIIEDAHQGSESIQQGVGSKTLIYTGVEPGNLAVVSVDETSAGYLTHLRGKAGI
jgi:hypothetical protein